MLIHLLTLVIVVECAYGQTLIEKTVDLLITLDMDKISGDDQSVCINTTAEPFVVRINFPNGTPLNQETDVKFSVIQFPENATGYSFSDTETVPIDTGNGEATISFMAGDGSGEYIIEAKALAPEVSVGNPQTFSITAVTIEIIFTPLFLCVNETSPLIAESRPDGREFSWGILVDNSNGAVVDGEGTLTAGDSQGTITVRVRDTEVEGCTDAVVLNVIDSEPEGPGQLEFCSSSIEIGLQCAEAYPLQFEATSWARENSPPRTDFSGLADAMRHAYWMCRMTRNPELGGEFAGSLGNAHEVTNLSGGSPCIDSAMDFHNNQAGILLGNQDCDDPPENCCEDLVLQATANGELVQNANGQLVSTTHAPEGF